MSEFVTLIDHSINSNLTILQGDCIDMLRALPEASIDVIVTSPPYNIKLGYSNYTDDKSEEDYLNWMVEVATALRRVMKPEASFFLNISGSPTAPWLPFELIVRLRSLFSLQNHITWIKSITAKDISIGHFKPVSSKRFLHHAHENIFHLTISGSVPLNRLAIGVPYTDKTNIARRGHSQDLRCRGNTWFIPYETVQNKAAKFNHPGTFPINLPVWCIKLHGQSNPVVLDPFMGTGTTLIAALREKGYGIGIDIDPGYIAIANDRIALEPI